MALFPIYAKIPGWHVPDRAWLRCRGEGGGNRIVSQFGIICKMDNGSLINGADGARFLAHIQEALSDPFLLALR